MLDLAPKRAIINDYSEDVSAFWKAQQDHLEPFIELCKYHIENDSLDYYNKMKKTKYNDILNKGVRLLYICKRSFGGNYRLNKKGECISSYAYHHKNPKWLKEKMTRENGEYLRKNDITILNKDYKEVTKLAKKGDFVFLDPPYPTKNNKKYYNIDEFNQRELKEEIDRLTDLGVKVIHTNANTEEIRELYKDYEITSVDIQRQIDNRKSFITQELIISNHNLIDSY